MQQIRATVASEFEQVNQLIIEQLHSNVPMVENVGHYIVDAGGKRLRPLLVLLSASALGRCHQDHIKFAAVIEFIHTATLLHDDVVDISSLRRGRPTANAEFGNAPSVLVGDFLYTRAFQLMVQLDDMPVLRHMADTTNTIAEGEVLQLINCHDADTTEDRYRQVIEFKTAKLFEASARLGAVLGKQPADIENAMALYGKHLGTAFQLIDDALDYGASNEDIGKNVGDDLAEGKPTLPLIYAMQHGTEEQIKIIRQSIEQGGLEHVEGVMSAIESTNAIAYTSRSARREADLAIEALTELPSSPYKEALYGLAEFSVNRSY